MNKNGVVRYSQSIFVVLESDTLIALIAPRPPLGSDEHAEDELVFELPPSASWAERKVAVVMKQQLHLPDYVLVAFFWLRLRTWALLLAWCLAAPLAQRWDLGPPYVSAPKVVQQPVGSAVG